MINYLEQVLSIKPSTKSIAKVELENLRKEMKLYKKKYQNEDKDIDIKSDDEGMMDAYEYERINEEFTKKLKKKKGARPYITSEVINEKELQPKTFDKTENEFNWIKNKCKLHFLFKTLNDNELNAIVNAFEKKQFKPKETIFNQGDASNVVYLVETGELTCEKILRPGDPPTRLPGYKTNDFFGDIALLYNHSRETTVKSKTQSTLWQLDRESYTSVTRLTSVNKRKEIVDVLKTIEFFKVFEEIELGKIYDAMKVVYVPAGNKIVNQGEQSDVFYVVDEGKAFEKNKDVIITYEKGGYFNEMALLNNVSRDAVQVESDCKLYCIDRKTFKRVLGPMEGYLQRNALMFRDYVKKPGNKQ